MATPYALHKQLIGVKVGYLLVDNNRKCEDSIATITYAAYLKQCDRKKDLRLKEGKGLGNEALLNWKALPLEWRDKLIAKFGNPEENTNPMANHYKIDIAARTFYEDYQHTDGTYLTPVEIERYTTNASTLNALNAFKNEMIANRRARQGSLVGLWDSLINTLVSFKSYLKKEHQTEYKLPKGIKIKAKLIAYMQNGSPNYAILVDNRRQNQSASKIKTDEQKSILESLLKKHTNLDNEQVAMMYNQVAAKLDWKKIVGATVGNRRAQLGLYIHGGNRGENSFDNNLGMQVKRSAPTRPLYYWTLDGWDAELLYQRTETNKNGHQVTTYHNRLCIVVVLDPVAGIKYPIGYAIGTHETPELITEALRNAANHTKELFGHRYKALQIQSDRYGNGALTPLYKAMSDIYTPARAKNAKAKVIEPYFNYLNKTYCQTHFENWSGFGVTSRKENQPNAEYLNKIRKNFPNETECRAQLENIINWERETKRERYLELWKLTNDEDKSLLSQTEYLNLFGITHQFTNRLHGKGFTPTFAGKATDFDSFDPRFRELAYMDWAIKYDPADLSQILVMNAKTDSNSKLKEIVGTHRFLLENKFVQPMALKDRKDGDSEELTLIKSFNKNLKASIMERNDSQRLITEQVMANPALNDTLTKLVLVDSTGQHKNQRNALKAAPKTIEIEPTDFEIINQDIRHNY